MILAWDRVEALLAEMRRLLGAAAASERAGDREAAAALGARAANKLAVAVHLQRGQATYRPYPQLARTEPCRECTWATFERAERRGRCRSCRGTRRTLLGKPRG